MMAEAGPRPHLPVSPGVGPIQGCRENCGRPRGPGRTVAAAGELRMASRGTWVGLPHPPQLGALGITASSGEWGGWRAATGSLAAEAAPASVPS